MYISFRFFYVPSTIFVFGESPFLHSKRNIAVAYIYYTYYAGTVYMHHLQNVFQLMERVIGIWKCYMVKCTCMLFVYVGIVMFCIFSLL